EGEKRNPEVKIESFFGVSEANIEEYTEILTELMSEAPTLEEDEERDKEIITPDRFREYVQFLAEKKQKLFTFRTIEPDGKVSGLTEIRFTHVNTPIIIEQALTGVRSNYRGRGLGKWLKAAMLVFIRENFHEAKYFITGNADHNAPMLSINNRLGFKPYRQRISYKFVIDNLKKKID
ncbi:MAG TPA: GNAT family N-acetyltransferase, partial [Candidatus Glassbacteria bacterium]|nr:GNAT family N-acetyltransferase [Candidatus Glassbacteria bacterium]